MQDDHEQPDPVLAAAIAQLHDQSPGRDLWPGIHERLPSRRRPGVWQVRWPVAIAAGLTLVAASMAGTAAWFARREAPPQAGVVAPASVMTAAAASERDQDVARAIAELEALLNANVTNIGTDTYRALARSLAILDQAIAGAAERQRAAPDDTTARRHFSASLRKKLDVLEKVTAMTSIRS